MTQPSDRRERYATAIHDAMETDLSLVDQEPAYQALIARAAEAAEALADAEQNRQFLTTLANLGIATHRLDRIRDTARLHRQQLLGTSELYAVIEADDEPEQCPRSEFDGYGLQCQKPAGHNLCTFEEQPAAVSAAVEPPADQTTPSHRAGLRDHIAGALIAWTYRGKEPDPETGILETVRANAYSRADAVLVVLYREWPWLRAEAEDAAPPAEAADRDRIAAAALAAVETALRDTLTPDARKEALAGIMAVLPEPADRATVLRDAAEALHARAKHYTGEFNDSDILHEDGPAATVATWKRAGAYVRRMADETATTETPFTPPAHYRRDDGVECCVHTIPVGPDSCPACRELAHNGPAAGPTIVDQVVAALQAKAQALSVEAEEEMRRDLEEQAQVWHEAADLARRTGRRAARSTQPAAGARQDGGRP